jgi:hypothetical protein
MRPSMEKMPGPKMRIKIAVIRKGNAASLRRTS